MYSMMDTKEHILDELLILQMQHGDNKALSLFVKRWHAKLVGFSYQTIKDYTEAQDIVQDCWQAIIKSIKRLNEPAHYKAWMYRIVRNKSVDRIRQFQRKRKVYDGLAENHENGQEENPDWLEDDLRLMRKMIAALPNDLREILQLFYLQKQSVHTISKIVGIPTGTVKSRLFRARDQLKKAMTEAKKHIEL